MQLPYAEDVNYWQTGASSPDTWIERAKNQIKALGGKTLMEAFGHDEKNNSAYMLGFQIGLDRFKVVWPVLPTRSGNIKAARIQAATMLYHDIKAKCLTAVIFGARSAFFSYLMLPDGSTAAQLADNELIQVIPKFLLLGGSNE
jgi:hypothetical protein